MKISAPFKEGRLIRRYKRFLADVELKTGEIITVHTPNTGSMLGCAEPGSRVWIYHNDNPKRKYPWSWELVEDLQGNLIGIHTGRVNSLVVEAITNGVVSELKDYNSIQQEKKFLNTSTRFDLLLQSENTTPDCYVEIKNVTAKENKTAIFPDAVTERGRRHLQVLQQAVEQGFRAVMFYCIQREDVENFSPAYDIDPDYAKTLLEAVNQGVEVLAYKASVGIEEIQLKMKVPLLIKLK